MTVAQFRLAMLAPIYLLLLLGEHGPVGPAQQEFMRLASPVLTVT